MTFISTLYYLAAIKTKANKNADMENSIAEILFNFFPYFLLKSSSFIIFTPYYFLSDCWAQPV